MSVFIDNGEGSTWSDFTLFPPWLRDSDGQTFYNETFLSPPTFQRLLNAAQGGGDAVPAFTRDVLGLHSPTATDEEQHNHA